MQIILILIIISLSMPCGIHLKCIGSFIIALKKIPICHLKNKNTLFKQDSGSHGNILHDLSCKTNHSLCENKKVNTVHRRKYAKNGFHFERTMQIWYISQVYESVSGTLSLVCSNNKWSGLPLTRSILQLQPFAYVHTLSPWGGGLTPGRRAPSSRGPCSCRRAPRPNPCSGSQTSETTCRGCDEL